MAQYFVRPDGNNANTGLADTAAGAWQTVKYALANAQNGVLAAGDSVFIAADGGTYTENTITIDRGVYVSGLRGVAAIDGTGGAAGSDILNITAHGVVLAGLLLQNAVDRGITTGNYFAATKVQANTCGGIGIFFATQNITSGGQVTAVGLSACSARTCTGNGFQPFDQSSANGAGTLTFCEAGDCGGIGFGAMGYCDFAGCLAYDNAGGGMTAAPTTAPAVLKLDSCTFEGNTGAGVSVTATNYRAGVVYNCAFTNNSTYGFSASAAFPTAGFFDYNNYHGNGTAARNNGITGTNDTANAPGYVAAASDDYTLDTGSAMIGAGYSPFKSPMQLNQGATIAEVATGGGGGTGFLGLRSGL